MQIWMSNTRTNRVDERELFALICDGLIFRRGSSSVTKRFQSLLALASLPWLDQPRVLDPARLVSEIHDAWDELWTLRACDLIGSDSLTGAKRCPLRSSSRDIHGELTVGNYLARPLHELAVFAASGGKGAQLRVGTHRQLIVDAQRLRGWRVIRGGAAR